MKRTISLLLSLLMLFVLCACGAAETAPAATEEPAAAEAPAETPETADESEASAYPENAAPVEQPDLDAAPNALADDQAALLEQILQIDALVQPGTAGSSLSTAVATASLLDWAENAQLSEAAVEVVMDYMASMTPEGQAEFDQKLDAVDAMVALLTGSDKEAAKSILSDAGMLNGCGFPWSKNATAVIELLMQSLGRRIG